MAVDEAGQHRAAGRVDLHVGRRLGLEPGDPPVLERHVARLQRQLAAAVVAEVSEPAAGMRSTCAAPLIEIVGR